MQRVWDLVTRPGWWIRVTRSVEGTTTLVEFWLEAAGDGVAVRVVESGFDSLDSTEEIRRRNREDNDDGWRQELDALARATERR
jgi:hypothetical protein